MVAQASAYGAGRWPTWVTLREKQELSDRPGDRSESLLNELLVERKRL
jgi:hypothetical protein